MPIALAVSLCLLFASDASAQAQTDQNAVRATKRLQALRIDEPITLDGEFDEPAWSRAEAARDFTQQEPNEGAPTSEPSEVRFLYDRDALYFAGRFTDSDPRGPIVDDLKRDFEGRNGDIVGVSIDTFGAYDAYNFNFNAAGVLRDTQSHEDGRVFNANWDGLWTVRTRRFTGGWTVEGRIPFKTMRFPETDEQDWAMNVFRLIRRKNEFTYWSPQPRQFSNYRISFGGRLTGIRDVRPGRNIQIKPFYTGSRSNLALPGLTRRWDADGGVDVKYGIGSSLALDLTLHTDFSQVEADEQQINLTRFSLLFPEKRDFFLENQGAFRIGDLSGRTVIPFFSRRIGLSPAGQPIPLLGGARLTGRQGDYTLGLLNIQTEAVDGRPADNFTTLRAARNFGGSSIGGFYLGREASGTTGHNRVAGADVHLNVSRALDVFGFLMASDATGGQQGRAGRLAFLVAQRNYSADVSYTNITPDFRNDLGFIARGDIGLVAWDVARHFRPAGGNRRLRLVSVGTLGEVFDDSAHSVLNSRRVRMYAREGFADGGTLNTSVDRNFERLPAPFEVSRGVFIDPGEYRFTQFLAGYASNQSSALSFSADTTLGDFYSGTIRGVTGSVRWRMNENFATSAALETNAIDLPQAGFDTQIARLRVDYSVNTRMFLNTYVQYNNATSSWLTNVRYRFMYRPLSDFYVVYNDARTSGRPGQRTFAIKHTLMLAF
jgi:hypothetical protein